MTTATMATPANPLVDLNQVHTKFTEKVKAKDKALKILMVLLFSIIGAVIFTKLLVRAIDIESEAQEYVLLDYKDDLNKKISFEAPQTDKE
jgi:hypoxanthine-guanine phosphoribosyltransferase